MQHYEPCKVESSTQMLCITPNLLYYLPPEYRNKLNDDATDITGGVSDPSRKKRESGSVLSLIQDYVESFAGMFLLMAFYLTQTNIQCAITCRYLCPNFDLFQRISTKSRFYTQVSPSAVLKMIILNAFG